MIAQRIERKSGTQQYTQGLRVLSLLLCLPSGASLLAKVYGLAPMHLTVLFITLPCGAILLGIWVWTRKADDDEFATALLLGSLGGFLATISYDVARLPFALAGQRIFTPISAYGLWVLNSETSTRFTELSGWAYHFSNGITFGLMYALFMKKRFWGWAIVWACLLETLAVLSPFARIFYLSGNYRAIGIAYFGHIAYGLPLGWMVYKWDATRDFLEDHKMPLTMLLSSLIILAMVWVVSMPEPVRRDAYVVAGEFAVEGNHLKPEWLRLKQPGEIRIYNSGNAPVSVHIKQTHQVAQIDSQQTVLLRFPQTGIYQLFIESEAMTKSSFVMVEPIEAVK
ncbi:MAG: hypothetical protein HY231_20430 [Acidobacteria bacterium]|nr:hypothetical protein [Acidobacteriota bacterium]